MRRTYGHFFSSKGFRAATDIQGDIWPLFNNYIWIYEIPHYILMEWEHQSAYKVSLNTHC